MKRFMLFAGMHYYPAGGWDDFVDSFDTVEDAVAHPKIVSEYWDWWQVVDTATGTVVA